MSDPAPDSNPHRSPADRAREDPPFDPCPWTTGSRKRWFTRPDYGSNNPPDCSGCVACPAQSGQHRCHIFGIPACAWPNPIPMTNHDDPAWTLPEDAGLAESWLT